MGTNTTAPWPSRTGCDCCLPEKVFQVPTCLLLLFPCSKPEVFLCPGKEPPSVVGCCSLQLEQLSAVGQTLTTVFSTHPARRCWEWDLSSPSGTATAPNCSCGLSPTPPAFGDTAVMPRGHNSHISSSAQLQGMRCPCPSAFLPLLLQAVQSISSSQDLPCHPSLTA